MKSGPQTPLRKHSLADTLAQRLQRRIAAGKFRTGERLPTESELMRMFGVGRSTVREAVRMLSDRGFLNVRQGAGTFVAAPAASDALVEQRLRRADIRELDEVRKILEAAIVERAAAPVTATAAAAELPRRKIRRALLILTVLVFSKYFYIACMTNYFTFFLMDKFAFSVQDAQYSLFAFLAASAAGTVIGGSIRKVRREDHVRSSVSRMRLRALVICASTVLTEIRI